MKALICNEFGSTKNLTLEEVKSPEPGAGQVLIDVHAAGINLLEDNSNFLTLFFCLVKRSLRYLFCLRQALDV